MYSDYPKSVKRYRKLSRSHTRLSFLYPNYKFPIFSQPQVLHSARNYCIILKRSIGKIVSATQFSSAIGDRRLILSFCSPRIQVSGFPAVSDVLCQRKLNRSVLFPHWNVPAHPPIWQCLVWIYKTIWQTDVANCAETLSLVLP